MKNSEYISKLYRPPLEKPKGEEYLFLDKNEPPFSAFESLDDLFSDDDILNLREYPNIYNLYIQLSEFTKVNIDNLLIAQGSEQVLKYIFEVFVQEGDEVVYYNPSFAMYDVYSYQKKAKVKQLEFNQDGTMNLDDILKTVSLETRLFSLINPHNFTGTYLDLKELKIIAEHTRKTNTIFLIDEAYYHYISVSAVELIEEYNHILVSRTFSKALGIAGARVGYAISSKKNIELLRKFKPINEIDYLSGVIASKTLEKAEDILAKNVNQVKKWQSIFKEASLKELKYIETNANYILLKSSNYEYHKELLKSNKIVTRLNFNVECLKDCIRFSVVDDKNMERVFNLLKGIYK